MNNIEGQLQQLLTQQKSEAETYVTSTSSFATYQAFSNAFYQINGSTLNSSTGGDSISIDFSSLTLLVDRWINELNYFVDDIKLQLQMFDPMTYDDVNRVTTLQMKVEYDIIQTYSELKTKITEIETDFSNVAIAYKTIVESSFNDMLIFNNNYHNNEGNFSAFNDVSVYLHGIEDDGEKFLSTMPEVAQAGDIVIHEQRDGSTAFFIVEQGKRGKLSLSESYSEKAIQRTPEYDEANGRIHMVYETEFQNEHRQKTSNDLAKALIDLGLMQGDKDIRMHAHSYGGRRSWQFALDYPDYVEAITTIGTPYDTNDFAKFGEDVANITEVIPHAIGKHPLEDGNHVEVDSLVGAAGKGVMLNDNAYGDMVQTSLDEVVDEVRVNNPEVYEEFTNIYTTAVVGKQSYLTGTFDSDGVVSADSQAGKVMGDLIDEEHAINIFRVGFAHTAETDHRKFKPIMKEINKINFR